MAWQQNCTKIHHKLLSVIAKNLKNVFLMEFMIKIKLKMSIFKSKTKPIICCSKEKNILSLISTMKYQEIMMNGKKANHSHSQM